MKYKYIIPVVLFIMLINACKKDDNTRIDYNKGIEGSQSFVVAEQMMVQLLNTYFKSLTDSTLLHTGRSVIDSAKVTYINDTVEKIRFEYPYWSPFENYGHRRGNSFEAVPRTSFSDTNTVIDIRFIDFLYDFDTLTVMDLSVKPLGKLDGANQHFEISANRVYRAYSDSSGVLSFAFNQQFVRFKDPASVYTLPGDRFEISGEMTGVSRGGLSFSVQILADSTAKMAFSCNYLQAGPATVVAQQFDHLSYVYFPETDNCMNQYTVIINNNPFPYPFD